MRGGGGAFFQCKRGSQIPSDADIVYMICWRVFTALVYVARSSANVLLYYTVQ